MAGPAAKREAVAHLRDDHQMSERRACELIEADRHMVRYRSTRPPDRALRARLRELAGERRRFGYRRLFIMLRREGEASGINRVYRLYREEGLAVRRRKGRKRAIGVGAPILVEARPNARWSLDFVHDQMANGRRFRVLNITDDVTRECLGAIAQDILDAGADYLLAFKANQSTIRQEIEDYFAEAPGSCLASHYQADKGHGRIEERTVMSGRRPAGKSVFCFVVRGVWRGVRSCLRPFDAASMMAAGPDVVRRSPVPITVSRS